MEILLEKMEQEVATEKAMVDLDAEVCAPSVRVACEYMPACRNTIAMRR
jgi:hypothetical protein